jgi:pyruvate/2-oxoglutarate dehydrogenase complex dihydrolipoamide acyltransferase (E2) component
VTDQPVRDGVAGRQEITPSPTADHRAVDDAPAARFLATLARCLSELAAAP